MPIDTRALPAERYRAATVDVAQQETAHHEFQRNGSGRGSYRTCQPARSSNSPFPAQNKSGLASESLADRTCRRCFASRWLQNEMRAQVFQTASCNWRCWYCFVPFNLLSANQAHSAWFTPCELMQLFLREPDRPFVLDLSGGQPELVPEWTHWMIEEIESSGLRGQVYLWSDDSLSGDYFWRYLSPAQQEAVGERSLLWPCRLLQGFDAESFAFNTRAEKSWFDRQFELMQRRVCSGMDVFAYATFTAPTSTGISEAMPRFVDRLQAIHESLPLRTVPLEIQKFTPVLTRLNDSHEQPSTISGERSKLGNGS